MVEGWVDKLVSEIAPLQRGFDLPNSQIEQGDFPIVYSNGIGKNHKYAMAKGPGLVTGRSGTIGSLTFIESDYFPHNTTLWVTNFKGNNEKFIYYLYHQIDWQRYSTGSGVPTLNRNDIHELALSLPSDVNEQRRIAAALSDADAYISALEKLIAKKRNIKQGAMQELLTGKRRLPGFSGGWMEKRIGGIGKTYSGLIGKNKSHFGQGNAKYITFLNVLLNTVIDIDILEHICVSENESQNIVKEYDLFFNTSSETPEEVGMCAVLTKPLTNTYLNSFCFGFRLTDGGIDGLFLSYFFNSFEGRKIMSLLAQGATRYNLSKAHFNDVILTLPDKPEQAAIAQILSDMDAEIDALAAKLNKARDIKQGMMSELLTGRIRLVELSVN